MAARNKKKQEEYENIVSRINKAEEWFRNQPYDPNIDESKEWKVLLELIEKANKLHYELFFKKGA